MDMILGLQGQSQDRSVSSDTCNDTTLCCHSLDGSTMCC